ncbi:MAG: CCA tRNA nucleotidyltransferase [Candidatus Margulisbacteria bacterium]|nr:CCA tRNA nucleotidyltransferase [Candidatus Margulisiibacteriota bacterium]
MKITVNIKTGAETIIKTLKLAGFQAYLVGGCVRDSLLGKTPIEWDITTSARPEEVSRLFKKAIPTGIEYGTVTILLTDGQYEVTTFRSDEKYVDGRHPANVHFTTDIHADLARRDFTVNAIAYDPATDQLIDDHAGQTDLKKKLIRTVGAATARFSEDGLRPVRACRFAAQLGFEIDNATLAAIPGSLATVKKVSVERFHDELIKMLAAAKPSIGLEYMRRSGLLEIVLPELNACVGVEQPPEFHPHDVYWHSLYSCDAAPQDNLTVRLAALFHDLGKPACKEGFTFYNHDKVGAEITERLMRRLKFSNDETGRVVNLVASHMFDYSAKWSDAAVRRFIRRIGGVGNVPNLFLLRQADVQAMRQNIGTDYLVELQARIDRIIADENALHVKNLKVNGQDIMRTLGIPPGPKVGQVLNDLLEKVLDEPNLNERETLLKLIRSYA